MAAEMRSGSETRQGGERGPRSGTEVKSNRFLGWQWCSGLFRSGRSGRPILGVDGTDDSHQTVDVDGGRWWWMLIDGGAILVQN